MRLRRSSKLMFFDPFTLTVCPASTGGAEGEVYLDDEHSLAHQTVGAFAVRALTYTASADGKTASLICHAASGDQGESEYHALISMINSEGLSILVCCDSFHDPAGNYEAPNTVERVVIAGQKKAPSRVTLRSESAASCECFPSQNSKRMVYLVLRIMIHHVAEESLEFTFDAENETVTIKKPNAKISEDWTLSLSF